MRIISDKKFKKWKADHKAMKEIRQILDSNKEDRHGNVTAYQWDKTITEIRRAASGIKVVTPEDEWSVKIPGFVKERTM